MKSYKILAPIMLILLFVASIYMLIDNKSSVQQQYDAFLEEARNYRDQGIDVDAENYYLSALGVKKSLELSIEIGEFYRDSDQIRKAVGWGESVVEDYPRDVEPYEFLMDIHYKRQDYAACFELADRFNKRKIPSEKISDILNDIEYSFYFSAEFVNVGPFSEGVCPVLVEGRWGYADATGETVIANKYAKVGNFSEGLAPVVDDDNSAYFIDTYGNKKHVVQGVDNVVELGDIENGVFPLYNGKKWSFYDYDNNLLFGDYDAVSSLGNGVVAVMKDNNWSFVDRDGNKLVDDSFYKIVIDEKGIVCRNGRAFVLKGTTFSMIDMQGNEYGNKYEDARLFNDATYAAVRVGGKWGFVDANGEMVITPQYEDARSFAHGLAAVKKGGKWGFITEENKMVIVPQFLDSKDFTSTGSVFVLTDDDWTLLKLFKDNHS